MAYHFTVSVLGGPGPIAQSFSWAQRLTPTASFWHCKKTCTKCKGMPSHPIPFVPNIHQEWSEQSIPSRQGQKAIQVEAPALFPLHVVAAEPEITNPEPLTSDASSFDGPSYKRNITLGSHCIFQATPPSPGEPVPTRVSCCWNRFQSVEHWLLAIQQLQINATSSIFDDQEQGPALSFGASPGCLVPTRQHPARFRIAVIRTMQWMWDFAGAKPSEF